MDCPACRIKARVTDSRKSGSSTRRRYACPNCHCRFTTKETRVVDLENQRDAEIEQLLEKSEMYELILERIHNIIKLNKNAMKGE